MNSLTKQRYISTSIWSDDWFDGLSEREKLVYFYLLTNEHTNAAGVYHCTLKNIRAETGIDKEAVINALAKFEADGKAFRYQEYVIITKWLKHQKIAARGKMFEGALAILRALPDEIKRFIADRRRYDFDVQKYVAIPESGEPPIISGVNEGKAAKIDEKPQELPKNAPVPLDTLSGKDDTEPQNSQKGDTLSIPYRYPIDTLSHDSDSDSDSDDDDDDDSFLKESLSGPCESPGEEKPAPGGGLSLSFFDFIKSESKKLGFPIPDNLAKHVEKTIPPDWLTGKNNFLRFTAAQLRDQYRKNPKTEAEFRNLYQAALWKSWDSFREIYPGWREKQENRPRASPPPEKCPDCGRALKKPSGQLITCKCGSFGERKGKIWEWSRPAGKEAIAALLAALPHSRAGPNTGHI
jgi:hypothetical protein